MMRSIGALIIVIAITFGASVVYYAVLPWYYGQQFKATRASNPYITTQQTSLIQFYTTWKKLEADKTRYPENSVALAGQQQAIVLQMRQQAALIPDNVPPEIAQFLAAHQ